MLKQIMISSVINLSQILVKALILFALFSWMTAFFMFFPVFLTQFNNWYSQATNPQWQLNILNLTPLFFTLSFLSLIGFLSYKVVVFRLLPPNMKDEDGNI